MRLRPLLVCQALVGLLAISVATARTGTLSGRKTEVLFKPYQAERATLSRDGKRFAYVLRSERRLTVAIVDLERPASPRKEISLEESPSMDVTHLEWASPSRLVLASATPAIFSIDTVTGKSRRVLDPVSFEDVSQEQPTPRPPRLLGPVPNEPGFYWVGGISYTLVQTAEEMSAELNALTGSTDGSDGTGSTDDFSTSSSFSSGASSTSPFGDTVEEPESYANRKFTKWYELVKLDLATGKFKSVSGISDSLDSDILYDRQGHPRLKQEKATLNQHFRYRPAKTGFFERWQDLDRWLGKEASLGFEVNRENFLGQRSFPLAFDQNPEVLYYASNIGRDGYGIFALDLKTKERREIAAAPAGFDLVDLNRPLSDQSLVFDRVSLQLTGIRFAMREPATRWLDETMVAVQTEVEAKFPDRNVQIIEWDDARERFLTLVSSPKDPGRYFVFYRTSGRCLECTRLAPWLKYDQANASEPFEFVTDKGIRITGHLTVPRATVVTPAPLVIWCHGGPWLRNPVGFGREAQALADLGNLVLQVDYRGSTGLGVAHASALSHTFDQIPLDDILAAMDWLRPLHPFDARRVAIGGEGFGGYLSLRAMMLYPQLFRCGISVNGPTNLQQLSEVSSQKREAEARESMRTTQKYMEQLSKMSSTNPRPPSMPIPERPPVDFVLEYNRWFFDRDPASSRRISITKEAKAIKRPLLLLHDPDSPTVAFSYVQALRKTLSRQGGNCKLREISPGFAYGDLAARAGVFDAIGEFVTEQFYEFDVEIGETKERK